MKLIAYRIPDLPALDLVPASRDRSWMTDLARVCLPMRVAAQCGWVVLNDIERTFVWDGTPDAGSINVVRDGTPGINGDLGPVAGGWLDFGGGHVARVLPYIMRTDPGWHLLVRPPPNTPKDGAYGFEGVTEADWFDGTIPMVWKILRPGERVTFAAREPLATLVPVRTGDLSNVDPEVRDLQTNPELCASYLEWRRKRSRNLGRIPAPPSDRDLAYMRNAHNPRLHLRGFSHVD